MNMEPIRKLAAEWEGVPLNYMASMAFALRSALAEAESAPEAPPAWLEKYLAARRRTIEASIAAERLAGRDDRVTIEEHALAEITALECETNRWHDAAPCPECAELQARIAAIPRRCGTCANPGEGTVGYPCDSCDPRNQRHLDMYWSLAQSAAYPAEGQCRNCGHALWSGRCPMCREHDAETVGGVSP